jgi:antitoxin component YwqK of YwqJK toxin-antitoxin module
MTVRYFWYVLFFFSACKNLKNSSSPKDEVRKYYPNGELMTIETKLNEHDTKLVEYSNKKITSIVKLRDNHLLDTSFRFYPNGQKSQQIFYDSLGNPYGPVYLWYDNGQLRQIGKFNGEGHMEGEWKYFYRDGKLESLENYSNEKKNGDWVYFGDSTTDDTLKVEVYRMDTLVSRRLIK